ncbi:MAG: general secretion pathway protein GspK [Verrucomicrobia bacterium]|nr:general secretion pathway protein GspK [Verrucomicrobiota bacterium]
MNCLRSPLQRQVRPDRGFVLVAVLVVVLLASMVAISLLFTMRAEESATSSMASSEQAWAAAMSGVEEVMRVVKSAPAGTTEWLDDPKSFQDRLVSEDGADRWYFTVYSPANEDAVRDMRYGVTDEASKLNLNAAHTPELLRLPRMTQPLVEALRDFIDNDASARSDGGEEEESADPGRLSYRVRNGALNTVEELLLVRGFTRSVVYGEDANMNFRLDPNEDDGDQTPPADNSDGRLDMGLSRLVTTFSYDLNTDARGRRRTNINDEHDALPATDLPAALTNFVTLLRTNHFHFAEATDLLEASVKLKDYRGIEVEAPSGIGKAELPALLDSFTTSSEPQRKGLINVNTASIAVLATVAGIDEPLAEAIVSARRSISPERRSTLAWLLQEDVVDATQFKTIAPHLTTRSLQYSFHVVGFGVPSGRYRVLEVVVDLGSNKPRVAYLRDLTRLGLPFNLDTVSDKEATGG